MGSPLFDAAFRTTNVTSGGMIAGLLPPAAALGTGRLLRLRQVIISNTTATAFGLAWGLATAAGTGAATAGPAAVRRQGGATPVDAPAVGSTVISYATTSPTAPAAFSGRIVVAGSSAFVINFDEGEEFWVPPAATPLPFCLWNTGTGQLADVTFTWKE